MQTMKQAAAEFLAGKRVAVTGVSRNPQSHGSNVVYQRLRQRGYQVFAVNPNADQVEGDPCYHDLASVPGGVDWVVIGTRPQTAEATMRECADLGIKRVWMHRGPGAGSVSPAAAEYGRQHGITVIEGGCPCMFNPTADPGHKAMRFVFTLTGNVPRRVLRPRTPHRRHQFIPRRHHRTCARTNARAGKGRRRPGPGTRADHVDRVVSVRQPAVARAWPVAGRWPALAAARPWPGGCDGWWR